MPGRSVDQGIQNDSRGYQVEPCPPMAAVAAVVMDDMDTRSCHDHLLWCVPVVAMIPDSMMSSVLTVCAVIVPPDGHSARILVVIVNMMSSVAFPSLGRCGGERKSQHKGQRHGQDKLSCGHGIGLLGRLVHLHVDSSLMNPA
jgi:hypothetical protein